MTVWSETTLLGIYTLTPTHCGTGQTAGAVDLPIARDTSTGFPVLPATGIKGVLRDYAGNAQKADGKTLLDPGEVNCLFGKNLDEGGERDKAETLEVGRLAFTEARLIAYPARSLTRPFLHVTCPLILERLARDLRAVDRSDLLQGWEAPELEGTTALVADSALVGPLVLEDLIYPPDQVDHSRELENLATRLSVLLPSGEGDTRNRLIKGLVLIPDEHFLCLMESGVPVQARIKLTGGKTTDKWKNPETQREESGNLWYEEYLPPDCLFLALVGERRQRVSPHADRRSCDRYGLETLAKVALELGVVQIGGNETVGQGLCYCVLHRAGEETQ